MKKFFTILGKVAVWLIVILAVGMMIFTLVSVSTFNKTDRNLFGFMAFIVQTDSMSKTDFNAGDLILTKKVDTSTLQPGDIITFLSQDPESFGQTITHKIRRLDVNAEGKTVGFVTYGTTTDQDDATIVTPGYVLGKYVGRVPVVGRLFAFLKTTPGYIVCIFVPFMLLILYYGIRCVNLFRRYKKEQNTEIEEERRKLEEERKQSAEMLAQLQQLQQQLASQQSGSSAPPQTPAAPTPSQTETPETVRQESTKENKQ